MSIAVVKHKPIGLSETFIRDHAALLPTETVLIHNFPPRRYGDTVTSIGVSQRILNKLQRISSRRTFSQQRNYGAYVRIFRQHQVTAVLAEYGQSAVAVREACRDLGIPLIVHFHGYDASVRDVLDEYEQDYKLVFRDAARIIAVSRAMVNQLESLGAPRNKLVYNSCGVDTTSFLAGTPSQADKILLATGRLVEKKAPHLLILAFAECSRTLPDAKLIIIGDGPLLSVCKDLIQSLKLSQNVTLMGAQEHEVVRQNMQKARAFVQHSVIAHNGDSEGTPVAILEACASALPVIATAHAGISDVVVNEVTGILTQERDISAMAKAMVRILDDPYLAQTLGQNGRKRIEDQFSMKKSIDTLWECVHSASLRTRI